MILAKKDVFRRSPAPKKPVGVVEAAGSNPVTQTRLNGNRKVPVFPLFSSFFRTFGCGFFCFFGSKKQTEKTPKFGLVHNLVHSFIWHFSKVGRCHAQKRSEKQGKFPVFWCKIRCKKTRKRRKQHGKHHQKVKRNVPRPYFLRYR